MEIITILMQILTINKNSFVKIEFLLKIWLEILVIYLQRIQDEMLYLIYQLNKMTGYRNFVYLWVVLETEILSVLITLTNCDSFLYHMD